MDFGTRSGRRLRASVLALLLGCGLSGQVRAAPFDDPHVGGLTFSGPTSGTLGAVYWNPAALGLIRGNQLMIAGTVRAVRTTVHRAPINGATGAPGGDTSPGDASASDVIQPIQYPLGPGGFAGISTDLGGDRFTLAFATYEPYSETVHFPTSATGDEPTRYHRLSADFRNLALVPALSIRVSGDLHIGVAPGFLFSTGRLFFAERIPGAAMGGAAESPASDARYDINSGQGIGDAKFSVTLGGGLYYRRRNFEFGLAYSSRPFGGDIAGVQVAGTRTSVTAPGGAPVVCRPPPVDPEAPGAAASQSTGCVFGSMAYRLPDTFIGGITWHLRHGLEITAIVRWMRFHAMERLDIRLTGTTLEAAGLPQHIVLHQGFQDAWDTRLRVSYWLKERLHIGAVLRVETSAVDPSDVSPAAVDGLKFEPILLAEVNLGKHFSVGAGYGVTVMRDVNASPSRFDPQAAAACMTTTGGKPAGDLANPGCIARNQGLARPTAEGTYGRFVQDFGLSMTARF
ncbi:MAG TPA: outer membrane protein transport protein [Polyangia bacterium]|nr:outer membrane protein transport protein [Polyangia bacterium]